MIYIALKNNKIIFICETNSEQGVIDSLKYENIIDYDQIQQIPNEYFQGKIGNDIREFDSNYEFLPLQERKDFVTIPEGKKIENNKFVDVTLKEQIDTGIKILEPKEIYDEQNNIIRERTVDELVEIQLLTIEEASKIKLDNCHLLRKSAYLNESDGLFFDYQRGEIEKSVWISKIEEIKIRFPKPVK